MNKTLILNKLREHLGFSSGKEFAEYLGIKPSTLSNWYTRNSFDVDLIASKCGFINLNWLITGEGSMLKEGETGMKMETQLEKGKELQLQKELNFSRSIIELQKKLIEALEEKTKELEERVKNKNNH